MSFSSSYLEQVVQIAQRLDEGSIESLAAAISRVRERGGRLFFLGVGGSAANASHAVNDFRKIAELECYCPTDNVSELTARINDEGWDTCFSTWLHGSRLNSRDAVFVFSVGGGSEEQGVSLNIVNAVNLAKSVGASVLGVVGRDGGHTAKHADAVAIVPTVAAALVTPHTEAFQAVVWHLLVSHPRVAVNQTKWESVAAPKVSAVP